MEETNFKITLADGTEIEGVMNGNEYVTQQAVTEEMLEDSNLVGMEINGEIMENMTLCDLLASSDGKHIIFRQKSTDDLLRERLEEYEAAIVELAELIAEV